jgi:O-antigen/teichoic acid export membrane protein
LTQADKQAGGADSKPDPVAAPGDFTLAGDMLTDAGGAHPSQPDVGTERTAGLDRSLVRGIAWTGGVKWATQILSWLSTLVVARLLTPGDYGIAGMAAAYIGFVQLVNEFGLSAAVVQQRDLTEDQIAELGGVSVGLGVFFTALSLVLATPIASFFGEPAVRSVLLALSVTFFASGFQVLPRSLLTRDLRFRELAWLDGLEAVTLTLATLAFAVAGFRYWALVLGGIVSRSIATIAAMLWYRHRLSWPRSLATIRAPIAFGAHIVGANIAWYAFRSADITVVGRFLGKAALGEYTVGWNLASIPVDKIAALVARASPAILASVQDDVAAMRRYVLALTEGVTLLTFPAAVGMALVADEFVRVVLGDRWESAISPLRILALAAVLRSVVPVLNYTLIATGRAKRNMQATIATAIVMPCLFVLGSRWGVVGVALAWLIGYPIVTAGFMMRYALAQCDLTLSQYARSLWPAFSASVVMAASVLVASRAIPDSWPLAARLAIKTGVGAGAYLSMVLLAFGDHLRAFIALARPSTT